LFDKLLIYKYLAQLYRTWG